MRFKPFMAVWGAGMLLIVAMGAAGTAQFWIGLGLGVAVLLASRSDPEGPWSRRTRTSAIGGFGTAWICPDCRQSNFAEGVPSGTYQCGHCGGLVDL